jgi:pimeloyl-ACP methyl ester carboxylesterase
MATFQSGSYHLAYDDMSGLSNDAGVALLVHGFASNRAENWRRLGWYGALSRAGYRLVALDLRGHGESERPQDVGAYDREQMAGDILALMDHLNLSRANLIG